MQTGRTAPFGGVVVDGDAAVFEEQGKGGPAIEGVADGLGQFALARDAGELGLAPDVEGLDAGTTFRLANGQALFGRAPRNLALDIVKHPDLVECFLCKRGTAALPDIVEIARRRL